MPPKRRGKKGYTLPKKSVIIRGKLKLLQEMPLDVLFEIFSHLDPLDVLNLARTTKTLRNHIMSRSARFIWTAALRNDPDLPPLPDDMNEPQYVNLAFSEHCHACLAKTELTLWAFRTRLCGSCLQERRFDDYYKVIQTMAGLQVQQCNELVLQADVNTSLGYPRTVSSYEDAEEVTAKINQLKGKDAERDEYITSRKDFVKKRQDHAFLAVKAGPRRDLRKMAERDAARGKRKDAICRRLEQMGYREQVEYINSSSPTILSEHPLVKSVEMLTDEGTTTVLDFGLQLIHALPDWRLIQPTLSQLMQEITGKMERKKRKVLLKTRQRHFLEVLKSYLAERPFDEINPRAIDFCVMPSVKVILLDRSKTAYTSEESFESLVADLPELSEDWRLAKMQHLLTLLPSGESKNPTILERATTFFRCTECSEPIGYPRVLAHACLTTLGHGHRNRDEDDDEIQLYSNLDSEPWDVDGQRISYFPEAVASAVAIVRACELDVVRTTLQDMEDVRAWLECLSCRHKSGKSVFRWRKAILHDMYHTSSKETARWQLLDADESEAAEALEQKGYGVNCVDALDFMCAKIGCRQPLSFPQMPGHMSMSHGIDEPELDEDYVLHEDASMHQPPFPLVLPHGSLTRKQAKPTRTL
ncbi:F-box domain-containing protein [Mycena indigotica]|uniref:F-box domain-containing protein n=1 Tax=Mycena indigotica TaxID=2126181 RepID=A0A8H6S9S9_9AGAR|nr:F-box domain-containing protein [Mycena indigotica]KAF7295468.1 F-box domain-containing protein [Mycena indigotica]